MYQMTVRPSYSVAYLVRADGLPPDRRNSILPRMNKPLGEISKKAATRLNNAMQWLLLFSKPKEVFSKSTGKRYKFLINFITLTLSGKQSHSDEYIKRHMLSPFIKWLARAHNAKLYIWKAEAQKNGNIHFHITLNTFVHWKSIRRKWNELQANHGYLKKWTEGNVHGDPNSTDVHAVIKTDEIARYMVKYMVKNQTDRRKITGHLWGCSPDLLSINIRMNEHDPLFSEASTMVAEQSEMQTLEHCTLFLHPRLNKMRIHKLLRTKLSETYIRIRGKVNKQTSFEIE